jgi:acetyltransferase-like isoleucine patch superfamily enzyme/dTDP-4-dehydrorhamnose 3,5-epimerase-like enzyme
MPRNFIHESSDVQASEIGQGTKIWQYCVILPEAKIGSNCNICAQVFIENDVVLGNDVTIKNGVQIWDGVRIEDKVFIGPNVTFTNDKKPRSKQTPPSFLKTVICFGASLGANSTILPGLTIGAGAMVGAGTVVTKSIPPYAIVVGNPGVIVGYVNANHDIKSQISDPEMIQEVLSLGVGGCALYTLPLVSDMRGDLSVTEYEKHIPFIPRRCFWVFKVPSRGVRGEHAHKTLHQYLICIKGSVSVVLDDSKNRREVLLNQPNLAIHIPPAVWGVQYKYSEDAVLLVLASDFYDSDDYLRSYDEFLTFIRGEAFEK